LELLGRSEGTQQLETVGEGAMSDIWFKVGDLVRTTSLHSKEYGMGIIIMVEDMPTDQTAVIPSTPYKTYLVSFPHAPSGAFRQWRGHNELRRLQ